MLKSVFCFLCLLVLVSCQKTEDAFVISTPAHFPSLSIPEDNPVTSLKVALGKRLFFDTRLSLDSTLSCASCHIPEFAFSDTTPLSLGIKGAKGKRNAPSLLNVGYEKLFNKDGGVIKLDLFSLLPIEDHSEMGIPVWQLVKRLQSDKQIQKESKEAFDRELDPYVLTRSLATFVRTLVSGNSKYDHYINGKTKLSPAEERGKILFFSEKNNCRTCHEGILFTNQAFENNGTKAIYEDQGRKLITAKETDRGKFKVPSLRNVAVTAPYMHDGSFKTLEEILDHYNKGGRQHPNKNELIKPLELSGQDKKDIISFLHTLTDKKFTNNSSLPQ